MKFGLMFFASSEDALVGDKYQLVVESAKFGDKHGFSSVWVPERHFTRYGALYPNPAVLHAALAMVTERIQLLAGSVVAPLHNPIRIAEEWSVVDNLSHGRIGISFASGWNPDDFAFFPDRYQNRSEEMHKIISAFQRLWRGEKIEITNGLGETSQVKIFPSPVQKELPMWLTASGNPKTYEAAGKMGANLLTHILDQGIEQLTEKIAIYRRARADAGFEPKTGQVSMMLHAFVGEDIDLVREQARRPFREFLKSSIGLLKGLAQSRGRSIDLSQLSESHLNEFLDFLYERFVTTRGIIGTPESSLDLVRQFEDAGVDEIACLLDFGPDRELILGYLPYLNKLKNLYCSDPQPLGLNNGHKPAIHLYSPATFSVGEIKTRCRQELSGDEFHSILEKRGIQIDSSIRFVDRIWRRDGEALATLVVPNGFSANGGYHVHPAYLDACGRVLAAALPQSLSNYENTLYLPVGMKSFRLHAKPDHVTWSHAVIKSGITNDSEILKGDVFVYDESDGLVLEIEDLQLKKALGQFAGQTGSQKSQYDDWLYHWEWKPAKFDNAPSNLEEPRFWLILDDSSNVGEELAALLESKGQACVLLDRSRNDENIREPVEATIRNQPEVSRVVHLCSLDSPHSDSLTTESLIVALERGIKSALELVQALAASTDGRRIETWFVTRGAASISSEKEHLAVAQASLWGFARALSVEHPNLWGGLIDLAPSDSPRTSAESLFSALSPQTPEDMLGVRAGQRYVPRLVPLSLSHADEPLQFPDNATFLITGGFGGLGRQLSLWLAERGVRHLCLVGRSASEQHATDFLNQLRSRGINVMSARADIAQEQDVADVIKRIGNSMPPLRGIFHLAGALDDALLVNESWERFTRIRTAKVEGAWNLHRFTSEIPLHYFVMFSSAASILTMPGQANYAMSSTFMDALAHHRRALGLRGLSVNWGPWAQVGHAETAYGREAHARLNSMGIDSIPLDDGFEVLGKLLEQDSAQAAVVRIDWTRLFETDPAISRLPMLSELAAKHESYPKIENAVQTEVLQTLRSMPAGEQRRFLMDFLAREFARTLKLPADYVVEPRQRLFDLGLDSIMALELKGKFERSFGHTFGPTLLFMHPTLESLCDYLLNSIVRAAGQGDDITVQEPMEQPAVEAGSEDEMVEMVLHEIAAGRS